MEMQPQKNNIDELLNEFKKRKGFKIEEKFFLDNEGNKKTICLISSENLNLENKSLNLVLKYLSTIVGDVIKSHEWDKAKRYCVKVAHEVLESINKKSGIKENDLFDTGTVSVNSKGTLKAFKDLGFSNHVFNYFIISDGKNGELFLAVDMTAQYNLDKRRGNYQMLGFYAKNKEELLSMLKDFYKEGDWSLSKD